ncbi:MAG: alginate export family protein [Leptospiraceae bacterium]|nr:alginate export family protein [Leptospiraceae bacterium]
MSFITQFGVNDMEKEERHEDHAFTWDMGFSFQHNWKPRLGFFFGYVTGDRNPNDKTNQRFEKLYGFARPWSSNDYIQMENVKTPKIVLEFEPIKKVQIDTAIVWFYLASSTDRWNTANGIRDKNGKSGDFMGFEYNFRIRFNIISRLKANLGYAYFKPGYFTISTSGRSQVSNFLYAEFTAQIFE